MLENQETHPLDQVFQIKAKQLFMEVAVSELWGNEHSDYGSNENIIFGCKLLMHSIHEDLEGLQETLEKDTPSADAVLAKMGLKSKDITNIKSIKKRA